MARYVEVVNSAEIKKEDEKMKQRKITSRQETIISRTEQMKIGLRSAMQKFFVADLVF